MVLEFVKWINKCYENGKGTTFIYNKEHNRGCKLSDRLRITSRKVMGYDNYRYIHDDWDEKGSAIRQAKNTVVFQGENFEDVMKSCNEVSKFVSEVQNVIKHTVIAFHILKQSVTGKDGAPEAVFYWHIDRKFELKDAYLSVIVNLRDTKTSMQVAGYKEYFYDGIGSAAIFYSKLWHKTGIAEDGTMKVAFFCGKDTLNPQTKKNNVGSKHLS